MKKYIRPVSCDITNPTMAPAPFALGALAGMAAKAMVGGVAAAAGHKVGSKMFGGDYNITRNNPEHCCCMLVMN